MPMYEFECDDCGKEFETLVRRESDIPAISCPACAGGRVTKMLSVPSAKVSAGPSLMPMNCGPGPNCGKPWCQRTG